MSDLYKDCIIPKDTHIGKDVKIGPRIVISGKEVILRDNVRLDAACVIGDDVNVGQGAWVRAGAVVLRSVPPNAIVEGNPAQVVGYLNRNIHEESRSNPRLLDIDALGDLARPTQVGLGVGDSALYLMRKISDARGVLTVGEIPEELPFIPARYFVISDVPSLELRGEHAHKKCHQFLICMHGSCRVLLDDGDQRCEVTLDRPDMGVLMPAMTWGTQYRYSRDAVLLVFASHHYEENDYLRTYDEFLEQLEGCKL